MIQKVAVELRAKAQYALFLLAFFAFALEMHADDKQCPKCHGSGWQVTIPAVGHYGVEKRSRNARYVARWFSPDIGTSVQGVAAVDVSATDESLTKETTPTAGELRAKPSLRNILQPRKTGCGPL